MAKRKHKKYIVKSVKIKKKETNSQGFAIICFILNFLILPGLGSLIGGKTKSGIWQLILFIIGGIGMYYFYTIFGIVALASWIWGIVTGAKLIQEARY